jgi:hypothetical protein
MTFSLNEAMVGGVRCPHRVGDGWSRPAIPLQAVTPGLQDGQLGPIAQAAH